MGNMGIGPRSEKKRDQKNVCFTHKTKTREKDDIRRYRSYVSIGFQK